VGAAVAQHSRGSTSAPKAATFICTRCGHSIRSIAAITIQPEYSTGAPTRSKRALEKKPIIEEEEDQVLADGDTICTGDGVLPGAIDARDLERLRIPPGKPFIICRPASMGGHYDS
jgi:hypothetical protein